MAFIYTHVYHEELGYSASNLMNDLYICLQMTGILTDEEIRIQNSVGDETYFIPYTSASKIEKESCEMESSLSLTNTRHNAQNQNSQSMARENGNTDISAVYALINSTFRGDGKQGGTYSLACRQSCVSQSCVCRSCVLSFHIISCQMTEM